MNGYVFINGYGLVQFVSEKKHEYPFHEPQYTGRVKYPRNVRSFDNKKWAKYDYYFSESEIFKTPQEAANYIITSQTKRG